MSRNWGLVFQNWLKGLGLGHELLPDLEVLIQTLHLWIWIMIPKSQICDVFSEEVNFEWFAPFSCFPAMGPEMGVVVFWGVLLGVVLKQKLRFGVRSKKCKVFWWDRCINLSCLEEADSTCIFDNELSWKYDTRIDIQITIARNINIH